MDLGSRIQGYGNFPLVSRTPFVSLTLFDQSQDPAPSFPTSQQEVSMQPSNRV